MSDNMVTIFAAICGSGLITGLINLTLSLLQHKWGRKNDIESLKKAIDDLHKAEAKSELDRVRLQMLVMMSDYPHETAEIMRVAEHYFKDLKGNWYLTSMFNKWLEDNGIAKPEWFKAE